MDEEFWQGLPEEVEAETYRSLHPDLAGMSNEEALIHYNFCGRGQGRVSNRLRDREDFIALIPNNAEALEIGPFCNPVLRGPSVQYFDVLSREGNVARAKSIGLDPHGAPEIDYVSTTGDLSTVNSRFEVVVSSHCIEHQPNLLGHLQDVGRLLAPGGAYFVLIPDKRYCFDHFIPASNLAEVMVAWHERRQVHALRSLIEHRTLTTHNDGLRHWQGDHGTPLANFGTRFRAAVQEFDGARGKYIDVHAWYFTPGSASQLLSALQDDGLSPLRVHRTYPTRYGATEFWMILRKEWSKAYMPGYIDLVDSRQVAGWALEADRKTPDRVIIYVDGREIAQVRPTLFHPGLRDAGLGDGWSGFRFYFPTLIGIREPANVVVRAASSGELLPHTVEGETLCTIEPAFWLSFRQGFSGSAYAAAAMSLARAETAASGDESLTLTARVLAPRDAILAIEPAPDCARITLGAVNTSAAVKLALPSNASEISDMSFDVCGSDLTSRKFLAFDLVDRNPANTGYGKRPINPMARMCFAMTDTWLTIPGEENYARTCGLVAQTSYINGGITLACQIYSIINEFVHFSKDITVLDWGVGSGRVAMPLKRGFMPAASVIGRDVDKVNVEWCKANLPDIVVEVCDFYPPLDLESSSVDVIYGISVMTHLTEGAQFAWLKELRRVLKIGGICILSTHGEYAVAFGTIDDESWLCIQDPSILERLGTFGISDGIIDGGPLGVSLMTNYYRGTYQTRKQVEDMWSKYMDIVAYYPAGVGIFQDMVVLKKL
jgi:SAM-dependent methyltransferase